MGPPFSHQGHLSVKVLKMKSARRPIVDLYFFHLSHQSPIKSAYVLETKLSLEVRHGKTPIFTFNEYSKLSFLCHLRFGVKFSEETLQFFRGFVSENITGNEGKLDECNYATQIRFCWNKGEVLSLPLVGMI